MIDLQGEH